MARLLLKVGKNCAVAIDFRKYNGKDEVSVKCRKLDSISLILDLFINSRLADITCRHPPYLECVFPSSLAFYLLTIKIVCV